MIFRWILGVKGCFTFWAWYKGIIGKWKILGDTGKTICTNSTNIHSFRVDAEASVFVAFSVAEELKYAKKNRDRNILISPISSMIKPWLGAGNLCFVGMICTKYKWYKKNNIYLIHIIPTKHMIYDLWEIFAGQTLPGHSPSPLHINQSQTLLQFKRIQKGSWHCFYKQPNICFRARIPWRWSISGSGIDRKW